MQVSRISLQYIPNLQEVDTAKEERENLSKRLEIFSTLRLIYVLFHETICGIQRYCISFYFILV